MSLFLSVHSFLLLLLFLLFLVCVPKLVTTNWIPISFRSHVPILYTMCIRILALTDSASDYYYYFTILLLFLLVLLFVHNILGSRASLCWYDIYLLVFGCDRRFMCDYHHDCMPRQYIRTWLLLFFSLFAGFVVSFVVVDLQMQQHNIIHTERSVLYTLKSNWFVDFNDMVHCLFKSSRMCVLFYVSCRLILL